MDTIYLFKSHNHHSSIYSSIGFATNEEEIKALVLDYMEECYIPKNRVENININMDVLQIKVTFIDWSEDKETHTYYLEKIEKRKVYESI